MKKSLLILFLTLVSCSSGLKNNIPERPENIAKKNLEFKIPEVERWTMPNGLEVVYVFNDELPQVKGSLFFPGGDLFDPAENIGISQALGSELRDGSFVGMAPEVLDKKLDNMAAVIETAYGEEYGVLGFSCLQEDFTEIFSLASNILLKPAFNEKRLALWKQHAIESINRRKDSPETMAAMSFAQLIYGKDSPYARAINVSNVNKINSKVLKDFHKKYIRPNGAWLVVVGAIEKDKLKQEIEKNFSSWSRNETKLPELPAVNEKTNPGVYVLNRDFDQATIMIGHYGPPRITDDIQAMGVYNRVLGAGGFGSLLFDEIRTRQGLAYDISGGLIPGAVKGLFQINIGTKNESAVLAVRKTLEVIDSTINQLPPEQVFGESKSAAEQSFVFRFNGSDAVAKRFVSQRLQGYPEDYDKLYLERVEKVTPSMVQDVAKKWLKKNDLVIVLVGRLSMEEIAKEFPNNKVYKLEFDIEPKIVN